MIPKVIIASVNESSVAYQLGLREGDQIVKINDKKGQRLTLNSVSSYFFKNPYSDLKITYRREGLDTNIVVPLVPLIK